MGTRGSHYITPYVYRRHASGRHQLLTPTADPKTLKAVVLQGSAMGYPTKRDLCAAIVVGDRPRWRFALKDGERVIAAELKSMRIPSPQASEKNG